MSVKDKLIERFKKQPKDFTFNELVSLFAILGFSLNNKGKTSGSRVIFEKGEDSYIAHKPHPSNIIKSYAMKQILDYLTDNNFINKEN
jgi:hypothetical protein